MDPKYQNPRVKVKNFAIRFEGDEAIITGSVTGYIFSWDPTYCPGCVRQVFLEVYDAATVSYIAVKQIRCTSSISELGFKDFTARLNIARSVFEEHDIELRVATTLSYCDTFTGKFNPQHGYGGIRGRLAYIHCPSRSRPTDSKGCDNKKFKGMEGVSVWVPEKRYGGAPPCGAVITIKKGYETSCSHFCQAQDQHLKCKERGHRKEWCDVKFSGGDMCVCEPAGNSLHPGTPIRMHACNMKDLLGLAGSHFQCTLALLGVQDPCSCLCTFAESDIREFTSCAFGVSNLNLHAQWQACKAHNSRCGRGDVVVVHGRHLRQR